MSWTTYEMDREVSTSYFHLPVGATVRHTATRTSVRRDESGDYRRMQPSSHCMFRKLLPSFIAQGDLHQVEEEEVLP